MSWTLLNCQPQNKTSAITTFKNFLSKILMTNGHELKIIVIRNNLNNKMNKKKSKKLN